MKADQNTITREICGRARLATDTVFAENDMEMRNRVKTALEMQCMDISASEALKQKVKKEISMKNAEKKQIRFHVKKFVIGVAAACLLISAGVAAGMTKGYKSSISPNYKYDSYADLEKAEEKFGSKVDSIENFGNGYGFKNITVNMSDAFDENGNTLYSFPEMWIYYERAGSPRLSLVIDNPPEYEKSAKAPDLTLMCGDVEIRNDVYTYKFVPEDYELTAEDEINQQRDDYYISYGSDKVEIRKAMHATWEKDGLHYNLFGFDLDVGGEELLEMAKEILEAN